MLVPRIRVGNSDAFVPTPFPGGNMETVKISSAASRTTYGSKAMKTEPKTPAKLGLRLQDMGAILESVGRIACIVVMMFAGYRLVVACSKSAYLREYMASLEPDSAISSDKFLSPHPPPTPEVKTKHMSKTTDSWPLLYPTYPDETGSILRQLAENHTLPCYQRRTFTSEVFGLPKPVNGKPIRLTTGRIHDLVLVSYEDSGRRRCSGGDFFETDLTGVNWKARPPVLDNQDGSYGVQLMVDSRFAGLFVFKVLLLFANFHGLEGNCTAWARVDPIITMEIEFAAPDNDLFGVKTLPDLRRCTDEDFSLKAWSGRWNRQHWNQTCEIGDDGRYICIDPREECTGPWCEGPVGHLESNGWVYSAHCKFKIFEEDEAWDCLKGRWLFFWGDSNHEDSVRNLLNLVLGLPLEDIKMRRWFDGTFHHPRNANYEIRITKIFNGHAEESGNLHGLFSLQNQRYRELLTSFFNGSVAPDTMVMNSGLHDAHYWKKVSDFALEGVEYATTFWKDLWKNSNPGGRLPTIVFRNTVTGAGFVGEKIHHARDGLPNPHKMEIYNRIFVERLQQLQLPNFKIIDAFDLTFPWHYDLNHTDGVHYGREPSKTLWPWGIFTQIGHQYFVDLMLIHILLNAMCPVN